MNELSDNEKTAIQQLVGEKGILWNALMKFLANKTAMYQAACSTDMASVPRNHERASDYASKAEVLRYLLPEIESFARSL